MVRVVDHEADDAIGTLAVRAAEQGMDAVIVTADRDFFQLVRPGIQVMFNRRGISDIVLYDEAGVEERFGVPPSKYLEYVALKGDPSDNIPGVPGVGEKTATKLIQEYGSVEALLEHADELRGKLKDNVLASAAQLTLNKELARIVTDLPLDIGPQDCVMGEWDPAEVRRLFTSLEFRSLLDRLNEVGVMKPKVEVTELDLREVSADELAAMIASDAPKGVRLDADLREVRGAAASPGERRPRSLRWPRWGRWQTPWHRLTRRSGPTTRRSWNESAFASGVEVAGVVFDTFLAGYLLDPAAAEYPLRALSEKYLGADVLGPVDEQEAGQLFSDAGWRTVAAEAAAIALLAPVMEEQIDKQGLRDLLETVEMPLASVLGRMEQRGVALDVAYLDGMGADVRGRMAELQAEIYREAGEEFNLNSPPQLRVILYEKLGLSPGKRTPKGQLSTDASVLEKLRDHPVVDALLDWRELDKLNSTYLEALPRLVDPRDGRIHTSFNQAVAATGRLSSSNPNLQNIPVRTELGRQIRRAFIPGGEGQVLLAADYSQIELRILAHLSGDEGLREAFASGHDIHTATSARVFGIPEDKVDPRSRSRAKMINYGLAYGLSAWGLASRLDIAPDEAQEIMDAYFESFPGIREFLDRQVDRATVDGYTETLLGRRRYIPELHAANPRVGIWVDAKR